MGYYSLLLCLLGNSFLLSGSPLEAGYFGAMHVQLATWRLELQAPLVHILK